MKQEWITEKIMARVGIKKGNDFMLSKAGKDKEELIGLLAIVMVS